MNIAVFAASALVVLSLVSNPDMQALRYEAGNSRYEVTQSTAGSVDGASQEESKVFARLALTITPEKADTLNVMADVDSLSTTSDGLSRTMLPRGARTVLRLLTSGEVVVSPSDEDVLGTLVNELFVRLPATGAVGAMVVDTIVETDEDMSELGISSINMVVNTRVTGDTTLDGTAAWKLELAGRLDPITKDSTMAGGSLKLVVNGTLAGTAYVSKTGTLLSLSRTGKVDLQMDISIMGTSQSLTMRHSDTIEARRLK